MTKASSKTKGPLLPIPKHAASIKCEKACAFTSEWLDFAGYWHGFLRFQQRGSEHILSSTNQDHLFRDEFEVPVIAGVHIPARPTPAAVSKQFCRP